MDKPKRTRREAVQMYYLTDVYDRLEFDLHTLLNHYKRIPHEWHVIHRERDYSKTRITLRVDCDVVKFFRSMGPEYQRRMNDVMRAFMHCKLAGLIDGPETVTEYRDGRWAHRPQPQFGDVERKID